MRKMAKKLELCRETVHRLDVETLLPGELRQVQGGIVSSDNQQCTFSARCATKIAAGCA